MRLAQPPRHLHTTQPTSSHRTNLAVTLQQHDNDKATAMQYKSGFGHTLLSRPIMTRLLHSCLHSTSVSEFVETIASKALGVAQQHICRLHAQRAWCLPVSSYGLAWVVSRAMAALHSLLTGACRQLACLSSEGQTVQQVSWHPAIGWMPSTRNISAAAAPGSSNVTCTV